MLSILLSLSYYHWILIAVSAWLSLCIYRLTFDPLAKFPGPKIAAVSSWWYTYWIYKGRFPEACEYLFDKYNTNIIRVAPNQLVFRTPQSLKDGIDRRADVYRGKFALRVLGFTSTSVSNIRDPTEHRRKRKLMNPGFSASVLAKQEPILIVPFADKLVEKLKATQGTAVNMCNYFDAVTTDIIGRLSFGGDIHMLDQPDTHPFLHVLPNALKLSVIAMGVPEVFMFLQFIYRNGPNWLIPKSLRGVADFASEQMRARAQRDADGSTEEQHDIMSVIMAGGKDVNDVERKFTQSEMNGEATTLVAGGGDTVATALSNIMFNLGTHPDIFSDLQQQIRTKFQNLEDIDTKTVSSEIPLMDAVINESMRLNPVLPGPMWRRTEKALVVDGELIPAATEIGVSRFSLFNNKDQIHSPREFIPRRWIEDLGDNLEGCQPFGAGPHTCIGRYLAMVEMRLIVAKLLWQFDWVLLTKEFDNPEYVVQYRKPLMMKAISRSDA